MEKEYQLPKEFAEKWVAALRSGEYEQGNGKLHLDNKYCCLGVACVINGVDLQYIDNQNLIMADMIGIESVMLMPEQLRGRMDEDTLVERVATMNDQGESFKTISNWISDNVQFI